MFTKHKLIAPKTPKNEPNSNKLKNVNKGKHNIKLKRIILIVNTAVRFFY